MNKTTKIIAGIILVLLIVWGITAARKTHTPGAPVKIGVIAPLTGVAADYGEQVKKGVEAASVSGVEFVYEDEQCDPKATLSAYKKLVEVDKVNYIVGPACGSPQEAVAPLLNNSDVIAIVPSAASKTLYSLSGGNLYNMQYSLEQEGAYIADQMYQKGYKNVVIINYQNEFSKVESDSFRSAFKGSVVKEISYSGDTSDVLTELTKLKGLKFDAIFSVDISFYFANGMGKLHQLGINVPVFSPYPAELPAIRQYDEGSYYSFPADITDGQGGIFGLSKQSAEVAAKIANMCGSDVSCAKSELAKEGFDANGVKERSLVLKQIKNGQPVLVQ